jgi:hypothetical protein
MVIGLATSITQLLRTKVSLCCEIVAVDDYSNVKGAGYAAFFPSFNFTHLARCAAAIFLRAEADMVRFTGADPTVFASAIGSDFSRALAHLARCARAILRREAADMIRVGRFAFRDIPEPFNDSTAEIARSNFSTSDCICLRSSRSC